MDDNEFLSNPIMSGTKFIASQWDPYNAQALGILDQEGRHAYYRPMTHMMYDLCYTIFKDNLWQYHLLNIILLVFAATLIYVLIGKICGQYEVALLTSLFYLIHPINGIVVNYIPASVFALETIFILVTILLLWASLERKNNRALYALSLLCSFLSLFWHESGIMTPFYVFATVLVFRNEPFKKKAAYLFPYFLIAFSFLIFRFFYLNINENILKKLLYYHMAWWEYPANLFQVFRWYIIQLFCMQSIVIEWAAPITHQGIFWNNLGLISLFVFLIFLIIRFARIKICQVAALWTLIGFTPVCLAAFRLPMDGVVIEPHWFIFSSIGFFILVAYFTLKVLDISKIGGSILLFILILAVGITAHNYNKIWLNQKTYNLFWTQQVPTLDAPLFYLGQIYQKEGAFNEARKYYKASLQGFSYDKDINNNLGVMDESEGNWKGAEANYRLALKANPFAASTYNNLGSVFFSQGRLVKAEKYFLQALAYNPLLLEPRRSLASIYLKHAEYQKAVDLCLKNLDIISDDPKTLLILTNIFILEKDFVKVKKYAAQILDLDNDPKDLTSLGVMMAQINDPVSALNCFEKSIQIDPGYLDAYLAAGTLLYNLGKYDGALKIWKIGSNIDLKDRRFNAYLAKVEALK